MQAQTLETITDDKENLKDHRFRLNSTESPDGSIEQGAELHQYRDILEGFQKEHPEVIGATVFGSQTKGLARTADDPKGKSDIDSYVYIDGDLEGLKNSDGTSNLDIDKLEGEFRSRVAQQMNLQESQTKDLRLRILTSKKMDEDLASLVSWEQTPSAERKIENMPRTTLGYLFHLKLGNGLDKFRNHILTTLETYPEDIRDEIWEKHIISQTRMMEVLKGKEATDINIARDENKLHPLTVSDARKYYHL